MKDKNAMKIFIYLFCIQFLIYFFVLAYKKYLKL